MQRFKMNKIVFYDLEVSPNYFLIGIKHEDGKIEQYSAFGKKATLKQKHINRVQKLLNEYAFVGFNSLNYDSPILHEMLKGKTTQQIHAMSFDLVEGDLKRWECNIASKNQIDIMEVAPQQASLKLYGARLGTKKLQDLPYGVHDKLTKPQTKKMAKYNVNDLDLTEALYTALLPQLKIRENLSKKYGIDVMSRSDAQVAEDVFKKLLGITKKPKIDKPNIVEYTAPKYIKFKSKELNKLRDKFEKTNYAINHKSGSIITPDWIKENDKVIIGGIAYTIGIGGIHSNEKSVAHVGDIKNADIQSMYPSLIINSGKFPIQLGAEWMNIYRGFRDDRILIKHSNKELSAMLKIFLNGSFGKLGSHYSVLYAPHLLLDTTITGQLTLLMTIEALVDAGITVLSANTDGVEYIDSTNKGQKLIDKLGKKSNLVWEHAAYKALYSRDVNSYVAVYDGEVKPKGFYAEAGLSKSPQYPIVQEAIREFLLNGTSMKKTIKKCKDPAQFCVSRAVTGGALWSSKTYPDTDEYEEYIKRVPFKQNKALEKRNDMYKRDFVLAEGMNNYIGKTVRYLYVVDGKPMFYKKSGNRVPQSDGCMPMMELTKKVPKNLDYNKYYELAERHLKELGWVK